MFVLGIMQCFGAGWMFRYKKLSTESKDKTSIKILTAVYWTMLIIIGPVTVFVFTPEMTGIPMWVGIVIFWVVVSIAVVISLVTKDKDTSLSKWYSDVFLYGAHELACELAIRHDELRTGSTPWWNPLFIFWWGFSIKYFIPWALWQLMMWNFSADMDVNKSTLRGYGSYHAFWQIMGFVIPFIGLILFVVPVFMFWGGEQEDINFDGEEHDALVAVENARKAALIAELDNTPVVGMADVDTAGANKVKPKIKADEDEI